MIRTFLVAVDLGSDPTDLSILAEDLKDSLMQDGFEVSSVKPWDSPAPEITAPFSMQPDPQAQLGYGF
jgi:hypothetical protein